MHVLFEIVKDTLNLDTLAKQGLLPPCHCPDLLWPWWRDNRAAVVSPGMSSVTFGCIARVTNHHIDGGVNEIFELQSVNFVGTSEGDGKYISVTAFQTMSVTTNPDKYI